MPLLVTTDSIWIDESGAAVPGNDVADLHSLDSQIDAVDRRGWIRLQPGTDTVELWLNPLSAAQQTVCAAVDFLRATPGDQSLVVRVHDRGSCGSLIAKSVDELPDVIREAIGLTSRPGFPLMQDRLTGCLPTDINDADVREMWRYLVSTRFAPTQELVDRVVAAPGRAKIVTVDAARGIRYLAHDRQTAALWKRPAGFAGLSLDEIPMPAPMRRSIRSDLATMLQEPRIVVSFVRGLRRLMPEAAPMDSYFRISVPLSRHPGSPERPVLVLLAPYA